MDFLTLTAKYEEWLRQQVEVNEKHVQKKHRDMAKGLFPFLRATYYRWSQLWPEVCKKLDSAPKVLAVGDLHLENFGTWRDSEGRLVWGVNDFDEAYQLSYLNDLVRLTASALVAIKEKDLQLSPRSACAAILDGYRGSLHAGGRPFVLAEKNAWLGKLAQMQIGSADVFWSRLRQHPRAGKNKVPSSARSLLEEALPESIGNWKLLARRAGLGSLGRPRFVALVRWHGGFVAREVKATTHSAAAWASGSSANEPNPNWSARILAQAVRCPDPTLKFDNGWMVRRLAPDSVKIELAESPIENQEFLMLRAMGRETANIHLGTTEATTAILDDLRSRSRCNADWLLSAAEKMLERLRGDWNEWRRRKR